MPHPPTPSPCTGEGEKSARKSDCAHLHSPSPTQLERGLGGEAGSPSPPRRRRVRRGGWGVRQTPLNPAFFSTN